MKKTLILSFSLLLSGMSFGQTYIGLTGGLNASKTNIDEPTEYIISGANSFKVGRTTNLYYGFILSNGLGTKGKINLQTGFNVVTKGYTSEAVYEDPIFRSTLDRRYDIKNFEIPLTLKLVIGRPNVGIDPYIIAGGYMGIVRKAHVKYDEILEELVTNTVLVDDKNESDHKPYDENDLAGSNIFANGLFLSNKKDLGFMYGGGFAFNLGGGTKLFIEAKSSRSFNNKSVFVDMNGNTSNPKVGNRVFYLSTGLLVPIFNKNSRTRSDD